MTHNLQNLANKHDALLLAEVAAFLHDWQKCIPQWRELGVQLDSSNISSILDRFEPEDPLKISGNNSISKLIKEGKDPTKAKHSSDWRIKLLGICHDVAHIDKPYDKNLGQPTSLISSVLGFETLAHEKSVELLEAVNNISGRNRNSFLNHLEKPFNNAVGDTRRPLNEVTLWDWGAATAAFWKAIAARYILENKLTETNLKWRILAVRFNGLGFLEQSVTIGDLLGRQTSLQSALNCVRTLLEETYPLGNEVYRDENGSAFIVPELENDSEDSQLLNLVENQILSTGWKSRFDLDGELKPQVYITKAHEKAIVLHESLKLDLPKITPFEDCANCWWQGEVTDICTVCGFRPQGWGGCSKKQEREARARNICYVCLKRRSKRAKTWLKNLHTTDQVTTRDTIWIDEVADKNGRLALVIGQFNLTDWLNGDMIKSLLAVCHPGSDTNKKPSFICKEPSFARLQRVWRTTQQFWQTVLADASLPKVECRLELTIESSNLDQPLANLGNYDLVLGTTKLSVLKYDSKLITIDNLYYLAKQLGAKTEELKSNQSAVEFVRQQLQNQQVSIEEPTGYGKSNTLRGKLNISNVTFNSTEYSPVIPILAEPRTFMALVPAEKSLDVIRTIKTKYEREMGKVRNRLPLHLGVVYFRRRTPLRAAIDAGRQMLSYKSPENEQLWQVQSKDKGQLPPEKQELANGTQQFNEIITLKLTKGDHTITWHVPAKMGDGTTDDEWYPYVFLETNDDDNKVTTERKRAIKSQRPGTTDPCWLVHAGDLKEGDQIYFTPSTFDFEFLDTTARRFEIYYDENGCRPRQTRPFYLEDLDRFQTLWDILKNLETSQRHQVIYTIEATRELWYGHNEKESLTDSVFEQFVTDTLANATWIKNKDKTWQNLSNEERQQLIQAGVRGELADLAELHLEILKER